jgi:hypothetical protein
MGEITFKHLHIMLSILRKFHKNRRKEGRIFLMGVLFCGEGPRGRSYGRTAALRLFVQPYDEDEETDD